eukprot:CAMPEP_0181230886 /NCGR_PEP_ID=MMETSP1096-20121128/34754_1 /TAXON_ID=156174 ORGANISM="Chrysochromulina ericina, Strain CCMP281" /NCGR_SAMPLE_ID=MMETSP1096 /ASSEMBLY_ACC=CAM_ASM_000453 /LENGTH=69 /DNA_ID=CAMNT_0023324775 /DNA_START=169 /DNA_END=378 /DNA_ORIENTATION=+
MIAAAEPSRLRGGARGTAMAGCTGTRLCAGARTAEQLQVSKACVCLIRVQAGRTWARPNSDPSLASRLP